MKGKTLTKYTFDDLLIKPNFSNINSRKEVKLTTDLNGLTLELPVISANMDTITEYKMCNTMHKAGGIGCHHRFYDKGFTKPNVNYIYSFGLGNEERMRVDYMHKNSQKYYCLDVAHGAQMQVVEQTIWFKKKYPNSWLMVGNFGSPSSVLQFLDKCQDYKHFYYPNTIKVGIGPGSACTTRIKTGVGYPQLSAINDIKNAFDDVFTEAPAIVADGGIKTSGDIAKALACGANAVMIGGMLAGTDETPGEIIQVHDKKFKQYRGSASKESYETQGKDWDCAEGESFTVQYKGSALNVLKDIEGGLKSSFSYVGARNLKEFQKMSEFIITSTNTVKENNSHGKINS